MGQLEGYGEMSEMGMQNSNFVTLVEELIFGTPVLYLAIFWNHVWDELVCFIPTDVDYFEASYNLNYGENVKVWKWLSDFILYWACNYLSMLGLKLIHVSKRGHWC